MKLDNSCTEDIIQKACAMSLPELKVAYNPKSQAKNDLQIDLQTVWMDFLGQHIDFYALNEPEKFAALLKDLSTYAVYALRAGQNSGAGHFSLISFEKDRTECILSSGNRKSILAKKLANGQWQVDNQTFGQFKVQSHRLGPGSDQYSLKIDELTLPRTIATMNYIAIFRAIAPDSNLSTEMATIRANAAYDEWRQKNPDDIYLGLLPEAAEYWNLGNQYYPIIKDENDRRLYQIQVYVHRIHAKDESQYLVNLQRVGFNLNEKVDVHDNTILHWAAQSKSVNSVREILQNGGDPLSKNNLSQTPWDLVIISKNHTDDFGIRRLLLAPLIKESINKKQTGENLDAVLHTECYHNNFISIADLIHAGANVFAPWNNTSQTGLEILLRMAQDKGLGWGTIKESFQILYEEMFKKNSQYDFTALIPLLPKSTPENIVASLTAAPPSNPPIGQISTDNPTQNQTIENMASTLQNLIATYCPAPTATLRYATIKYEKNGKEYLQLTRQEPQKNRNTTLLDIHPTSVTVYQALNNDNHFTEDKRISLILGSLGIPPSYPEKLYLSNPHSPLGKAILAAYDTIKAAHDNDDNDDNELEITTLRI